MHDIRRSIEMGAFLSFRESCFKKWGSSDSEEESDGEKMS
jgi:queuine/archaeosine tRNA-ribosyltransferase